MTKRSRLPEEAEEEFPTLSPSELGDRSWKSLERIFEAERGDRPMPDNLSADDPLRSVGTLSSPATDDDDDATEEGEAEGPDRTRRTRPAR